MSFVRCQGCHTPGGCGEYGACLNTAVVCHTLTLRRAAGTTPVGLDHSGADASAPKQPAQTAPARPPAAPPSAARAPGGGSVTERIFAACDAQLARLDGLRQDAGTRSPVVQGQVLKDARNAAIGELVDAGVNVNSARKGSSMWVQSRS